MKNEYTVIIEQDEAGYYVAEVPEFYGCHTQAKSLDELMVQVKEAIQLCKETDKLANRPRKHLIGVQRIAV
jgi:predicted RNase H-like HicB family nuclease